MAEDTTHFVFVNGEKLSLLEDGRLHLRHYFPEGTVLYDPGYTPAQEVKLCTDPEEQGVTRRKLLPFAHYEAFYVDSDTGLLFPAVKKYKCVYVSNLPANTTPRMLGQFFETIGMVEVADIFHGPDVDCKGRGWVVLQDEKKLLHVPRVVEFFPKHFIYIEHSDREPIMRMPLKATPHDPGLFFPPPPPPPPPPPLQAGSAVSQRLPPPSGSVSPSSGGPIVPQPRSSLAQQQQLGSVRSPVRPGGGTVGIAPIGGGARDMPLPAPQPPHPPPRSSNLRNSPASPTGNSGKFHFLVYLPEKEMEAAVTESVFYTSTASEEEFMATLETRGPVFIIFLLQAHAAVFGCARLLPPVSRRSGATSPPPGMAACAVEWLAHHVFLTEPQLRTIHASGVLKLRDGLLLSAELGGGVREMVCGATPSSPDIDSLPTYGPGQGPLAAPPPSHRGGGPVSRGGGGYFGRGRGVSSAAGTSPYAGRGGAGRGGGGVVPLQPLSDGAPGPHIPTPASWRSNGSSQQLPPPPPPPATQQQQSAQPSSSTHERGRGGVDLRGSGSGRRGGRGSYASERF